MFDGVCADATFHVDMPALNVLRDGSWQPGCKCASTDAGMVGSDAPLLNAPKHISIATGLKAARQLVVGNGKIKRQN